MSVNKKTTAFIKLGELIEDYVSRLGTRTSISISGINIDKGFIPTVANMNGVDTSKYKIVPKDFFACNLMHIGRDVTIPIAYNNHEREIAVSPAYYIFNIREDKKECIMPLYLNMILTRKEFGRLSWFYTDSSIRGNLPEKAFHSIEIPLPSIEVQQELVDTYNGLKALAEENEALIEPLTNACNAFIIDCKSKYQNIEIGNFIDIYHEKNTDCKITLEQGININKVFITPHRPNSDLTSRIIVKRGQFAYCTQLNNENVAIAYREGEDCVVSPVYNAFEIKKDMKESLLPEYLFLWLRRKEFGRYVYWKSIGSAYEFLQEENLCEYKIPFPPIEVQESIVNIYKCLEEAKSIAAEARERLKTLCPALVQRAINS